MQKGHVYFYTACHHLEMKQGIEKYALNSQNLKVITYSCPGKQSTLLITYLKSASPGSLDACRIQPENSSSSIFSSSKI
ncbi:MAG: hypothetical protein RL553_246 [Planctomycetota bacterium]